MPRTRQPAPPTERMANYRARIRQAGLRPVQIWVPDTRVPDFAAICHKQAQAVAGHDPGGEDVMRWIEEVYLWPEP